MRQIKMMAALCALMLLTAVSCKKSDVENKTRVYFSYKIGYSESYTQPDGSAGERCIAGDGMCNFELRPDWRPTGPMAEGEGFGYLTLTSSLKLRMVIFVPYMTANTYKQHYADGVASIPGPWKVATKLVTGLGLTDGYSVSMGDYSIALDTEDGYDVLVITF